MAITKEDTLLSNGLIARAFTQSVAEASELIADPGDGQAAKIISFIASMTAAGTLALSSDDTDLVSAMTLATGQPLVLKGSSRQPVAEGESSMSVTLTTTTGAAAGQVVFKIIPKA